MIDPLRFALLVLVGIWSALDGSSLGQFLISRPMVSATFAGWVLGDPASGLLVGMILEGAHLAEVPAGGARFPEPGPAGVVAALAFIRLGQPGGLAAGLGLGVIMSLLGGATVMAQRYLNGVLVQPLEEGTVGARELALRHWSCVAYDGVRGALLTVAGLAAALLLPLGIADRWTLSMPVSVALFLMPAFLAGGALLGDWARGWSRRLIFVAGCAGGLALALAV